MATLTTGKTWITGDEVTPAELNKMVNDATIAGIVNADIASAADIAGSKLADGGVTAAKLASALDLTGKSVTLPVGSVNPAALATDAVETIKINSAAVTAAKLSGAQTGSAPVFGVRAWVNFNGLNDTSNAESLTNTNRYIRASGNVSSVLRNATGDYTVNFSTALPNANYAVSVVTVSNGTGDPRLHGLIKGSREGGATNKTTSSVALLCGAPNSSTPQDVSDVSVIIVG